jgi:inhibitor of KinA sporulation pathway (predicted exonuclease)
MATTIYKSANIYLVDGTEIYVTPLKIKYLRQFMDKFDQLKQADSNSQDANRLLMESVVIAMKQYYPSIKTVQNLEDSIDMPNLYVFLEASAGIKLKPSEDEKEDPEDDENSWGKLDLAKLEAEVFLLGIWKDYEELEASLSMAELTETLNAKREAEYSEKKFLAAMQGVDLDKQSGKEDAWEKMKAKVFSGGQASNSNDILAYQGANASKAGFGIGMGLSYEKL